MMRYCVLIAGVPASGKTTFARHAAKALGLPMISKDTLKEILYDTLGFTSHEEKVKLSIAASQLLLYYADSLMKAEKTFIMENNFENVMKPEVTRLIQRHTYSPVTVRFGGDLDVIYRRYLAREGQPERHGGHRANSAWPQRQEELLLAPMDREAFVQGVHARGIVDFSVGGEEIYVDATDYARVSYDDIVARLQHLLGRPATEESL